MSANILGATLYLFIAKVQCKVYSKDTDKGQRIKKNNNFTLIRNIQSFKT